MTEQDKIENRIRALLAKANGTENEHEAQAFSEKALELLAEHNLDLAKIQGAASKSDVKVVEKRIDIYHRAWEGWVYQACASMYFCDSYNHRFIYRTRSRRSYVVKGITIVGKPHNIEVAESMAQYLVKTIQRLTRDSGRGENFSKGAANRVYSRMKEIWEGRSKPQVSTSNPGNLPALYGSEKKAVEEFLKGLNLKVTTSRSRISDASDYMAGVKAGNSINLNTQVGGGGQRKIASA